MVEGILADDGGKVDDADQKEVPGKEREGGKNGGDKNVTRSDKTILLAIGTACLVFAGALGLGAYAVFGRGSSPALIEHHASEDAQSGAGTRPKRNRALDEDRAAEHGGRSSVRMPWTDTARGDKQGSGRMWRE